MKKKGFTLVELAIVLVIVGLLIGGILAAQSMISTVKVQRVVRDVQQYNIAFYRFREIYHYWPGDTPNTYDLIGTACGAGDGTPEGVNGNGDGEISKTTADEPGIALCMLNLLEFIDEPPIIVPGNTLGVRAFKSSYSSNAYYNFIDPNHGLGIPTTTFSLHDATNDDDRVGVMSSADGLAIDTKMDDGNPSTGNVEASFSIINNASVGCGQWGGPQVVSTYDLTQTSNYCRIFFRLPENIY